MRPVARGAVVVIDIKRFDDDGRDWLLVRGAEFFAVELGAIDADSSRNLIFWLTAIVVFKSRYGIGRLHKRAQHDLDDTIFDE